MRNDYVPTCPCTQRAMKAAARSAELWAYTKSRHEIERQIDDAEYPAGYVSPMKAEAMRRLRRVPE